METIQGPNVSVWLLNSFPLKYAPELWKWLNSPREVNFDDYGPRTYSEFFAEMNRRVVSEITWAIRNGGAVVGYLGFAKQNPICGQFHGMVIDPKYRGKGIGKLALAQAMVDLKNMGFETLNVMIYEQNHPAVGLFHDHMKFRITGMLCDVTKHNGRDTNMVILQKRLD